MKRHDEHGGVFKATILSLKRFYIFFGENMISFFIYVLNLVNCAQRLDNV